MSLTLLTLLAGLLSGEDSLPSLPAAIDPSAPQIWIGLQYERAILFGIGPGIADLSGHGLATNVSLRGFHPWIGVDAGIGFLDWEARSEGVASSDNAVITAMVGPEIFGSLGHVEPCFGVRVGLGLNHLESTGLSGSIDETDSSLITELDGGVRVRAFNSGTCR